MPAITLAIDFGVLPSGPLGVSVSIGGFVFTSPPGTSPAISNIAREQGYVFSDMGVKASLPGLASMVEIRICTKASEVHVEALNSLGVVVASERIPAQHCQDVRLLGGEIAVVKASAGSGEACIVRISTSVNVC